MAGLALHPGPAFRFLTVLTVALALLTPPPARCASCSVGLADCSHCSTNAAATKAASSRPCCQHHTAQHKLASNAGGCPRVESRTCHCNLRPAEQTLAPGDHQSLLNDDLAVLHIVQPAAGDALQASFTADTFVADLPPPLPHRILHCSWII